MMKDIYKITEIDKKTGLMLACHFIFLFILYSVLRYYDVLQIFVNNNNLLNWDSSWYLSIKESGYRLIPEKPCNLAFFPLFPYFWKLTNLSTVGISILNLLIFFSSFFLLVRKYQLPSIYLLLILSIPSFIFFLLPYSESIFFLFSSILLKGYDQDSNKLKLLGFLGASLSRSASLTFIPAILICELFNYDTSKPLKQKWASIGISIAACLVGVLGTAVLQWIQTGKWFYFLKIQQYWNRSWIMPKFPITTYDPQRILGLDAIAFAFGIMAIFFCVKWFWLKIITDKNPRFNNSNLKAGTIFSMLFVSATFIIDLSFSHYVKDSTNIWSINRHLMCTPFFVTFLIWLFKTMEGKLVNVLGIAGSIMSCVLLTAMWNYPILLTYYGLFFLPFFILKILPSSNYYLFPFYLINLALQLFLLQDFLNGRWIA